MTQTPKPMRVKEAMEIVLIGSGQKELTNQPISIREYEYAKGFLEAIERVKPIIKSVEKHWESTKGAGCNCGAKEALKLWASIQGDGE